MAQTIDELKNRYYKIVLEKGSLLYSAWKKSKTPSKMIVAKATEYAFDKRLKTDGAIRFQALAFAYALGVRLEKRYCNFLRKIFLLFAFFRERRALKTLKRVLGFRVDTALRGMVEAEINNLSVLLTSNGNQDTTGGGKTSETGDMPTEEALRNFIDECEKETEKEAKQDSTDDIEEVLDEQDEKNFDEKEADEREKISVDEKGELEKEPEDGKALSQEEKTERQKTEQSPEKEAETSERGKEEKPMEKSVASTSIIAEMMVASQERAEETPSPFPVFREPIDGKTIARTSDEPTATKEQGETESVRERGDRTESLRTETEEIKGPFPVFNKGVGAEKPTDKPMEKPTEKSTGRTESRREAQLRAVMGDGKNYQPKLKSSYDGMKVSEENKARGDLNTKMSEKQIEAIVAQLHAYAKGFMAQQERAWREKISIAESGNTVQTQTKSVGGNPNGGKVTQVQKK